MWFPLCTTSRGRLLSAGRLIVLAALPLALPYLSSVGFAKDVPRSPTEDKSDSDETFRDTARVGKARYTHREQHDRHGIGKFYLGREIAGVMGYGPGGQGAAWLERSAREREERLSLLVKSLRLKPGMVVADVGAGSGVISLLMAEQLLPNGKVLAVDVQREMLDRLQQRSKKLGVQNVEPVLGTSTSPMLPAISIDLALFVDVYHEFEYPYEMMSAISKALKPGGRAVFVEYRKEDPTVPIKLVHKMSVAQVRKEISQQEFLLEWKETIGVLPRQHIIVFERIRDRAETSPIIRSGIDANR